MSSVQADDLQGVDNISHCPSCGLDEEIRRTAPTFCSRCRFPLLLIGERYRLVRELAQGGFGAVFLAKDLKEKRVAVVKLIKPEHLQTESLLIRFRREIRITTQLAQQNEHVVEIFDHGEEAGLGYYYVMEFLDGLSLAEYLKPKSQHSLQDIFWIFSQFCEVMQEAHNSGIVHRDLKPDNLFLVTKDHNPLFLKVLDFGIAKPLQGTANDGLTSNAIGTPHYMAPEQCINKDVDIRTDIYAMGVILYEMLTGTVPFGGSGDSPLSIVFAHISNAPQLMSHRCPERSISPELDKVVLKAMEKEPKNRYQSALALWEDLLECSEAAEFRAPENAATVVSLRPVNEKVTASLKAKTAISTLPSFSEFKQPIRTAKADSGFLPQEDLPTHEDDDFRIGDSFELQGDKAFAMTADIDLMEASSLGTEGPVEKRVEKSPLPSADAQAPKGMILGVVALVIMLGGVGAAGFFLFGKRDSPGTKGIQGATIVKQRQLSPGPDQRAKSAAPRVVVPPPVVRRVSPRATQSPREPAHPVRTKLPLPTRRIAAPRPLRIAAPRPLRVAPRRTLPPRRVPRRVVHRVSARRHKLCGFAAPGFRWVFGQSTSPPSADIQVKMPRCRGCKVIARSKGYCLLLPRSQSRLRVKLSAGGFRTCTHWLTHQHRKILWMLAGEDPDSLGGSSYYPCFKEVP